MLGDFNSVAIACLITFFSATAPLQAQPACTQANVEKARTQYRNGDVQAVLATLSACLLPGASKPPRTALLVYLRAALTLEDEERARTAAEVLVIQYPEYRPNPARETPALITMMQQVHSLVKDQSPPVLRRKPDDLILSLKAQQAFKELDLLAYFDDPDEDPLRFEVYVDDERVANVRLNTRTLAVEAHQPGATTVTVAAQDAFGARIEASFNVIVHDQVAVKTAESAESASSEAERLFQPYTPNTPPSWVRNRPVQPGYYIGIGVAEKHQRSASGAGFTYLQQAKAKALEDLASEIAIAVEGSFVASITEAEGTVSEDVAATVRTDVAASLQGYELVDTWESDEAYWCYYRLSRAEHAQRVATRRSAALGLARKILMDGHAALAAGDIAQALALYSSALVALQEAAVEQTGGVATALLSEAYRATAETLSNITLATPPMPVRVKRGRTEQAKIPIRALFSDQPVALLPIRFGLERGSGAVLEEVQTGAGGEAATRLLRLSPETRTLLIAAELDLTPYFEEAPTSGFLSRLLATLPRPNTHIQVEVENVLMYLEAKERVLGTPLTEPVVAPELKRALGAYGIDFTETPDDADYVLHLDAATRQGSAVSGIHTAFADVVVTCKEAATGQERYASTLRDVRGGQLNPEAAGRDALKAAAERAAEQLAPDLIRHLFP